MSSLAQEAAIWGIPLVVKITDSARYGYCDAHEAGLSSINAEKQTAVYRGHCMFGNIYRQELTFQELRKQLQIINGECVFGVAKTEKTPTIKEY